MWGGKVGGLEREFVQLISGLHWRYMLTRPLEVEPWDV